MNSRNRSRPTYRNLIRIDILVLLGVMVVAACALVFVLAYEGNERYKSEQAAANLQRQIDQVRLDSLESQERSQLLLERYALEDRVQGFEMNLVSNKEVRRVDLRNPALSNPTITAAR